MVVVMAVINAPRVVDTTAVPPPLPLPLLPAMWQALTTLAATTCAALCCCSCREVFCTRARGRSSWQLMMRTLLIMIMIMMTMMMKAEVMSGVDGAA